MNVVDRLTKLLSRIDGYGEIRYAFSKAFTMELRNGVPVTVNPVDMVGGSIRILMPGYGWGFAVFNSLDDIERSLIDAIDSSRAVVPEEPIELVEVEPVVAEVIQSVDDDFREHSLQDKFDMLKEYDEIGASVDDRIIQRVLRYSDLHNREYLLTTEGARIVTETADCVLRTSFRARAADIVQSSHRSHASRNSFADLTNKQDMVRETARKSAQLLDAKSVKGGIYPVVLDTNLAGVFIHEAFGHLSESDFIDENPQAQEMMKLGRKFGPEFLNVFDDGRVMPEIRGTISYHDEGVPAGRTYLIEQGVLVGRLHSRQTAGKLSEKPTGNARIQDFRYPPIVRMTNTAIEAGPHPAKNIFDGIKEGVYAIDAYGGQTQLENFSFSAGYGYMIRDGEIAELVRDVVLQGNLFETLANIDKIGDDFKWDKSGGYCGKDGQRVPTAEGSPHVKINNVIIAGK